MPNCARHPISCGVPHCLDSLLAKVWLLRGWATFYSAPNRPKPVPTTQRPKSLHTTISKDTKQPGAQNCAVRSCDCCKQFTPNSRAVPTRLLQAGQARSLHHRRAVGTWATLDLSMYAPASYRFCIACLHWAPGALQRHRAVSSFPLPVGPTPPRLRPHRGRSVGSGLRRHVRHLVIHWLHVHWPVVHRHLSGRFEMRFCKLKSSPKGKRIRLNGKFSQQALLAHCRGQAVIGVSNRPRQSRARRA